MIALNPRGVAPARRAAGGFSSGIRPLFVLALLTLLCFGPLALPAQEDTSDYDEETPLADAVVQDRLARIAQKLQLSQEQLPAVEAILLDFNAQTAANPPTTPEAKRARRQALRAALSDVLSPEQRALLKANRQTNPAAPARNASTQPGTKRNWLDVLLDDIAAPLLENRRQPRQPQ